jgi:hypothetical protein
LLDPQEVVMVMLTGCPDSLRRQLRFRESLLETLHSVINPPHSLANMTEPGFLTGLLPEPLRKLPFTGTNFLIESLHLSRASLSITRQCVDPLGEISQYILESRFVFPQ